MAFLDFLNKDIGGMTGAVNDPGGLGVHAGKGATGIKWGDVLTQAAKASKPQQTSPFTNSLTSHYPGASQQQQPMQLQQSFLEDMPEGKQSDTSDMASILSIISAIYGIPIG